MQIIAVLIVGTTLLVFNFVGAHEPSFWLTLVAILASVVGINIIMLSIITEPLKRLIAALGQSAGESMPIHPPNPNVKRYENSGLKPILQYIYEAPLSKAEVTKETSLQPNKEELFTNALEHASIGFAIFDDNGHVIYTNGHVPLKTDNENHQKLDVLFSTEESLDEWIQKSEDSAVHNERTWTRIPSKPMGEEGRKLYDIAATYNKGSNAPLTLVMLEKTAEYKPEDDDLNFISFAAHELRGPITVIRGYLDTLNDELAPVMDSEHQELFKRLIVSSNRLDSYINNILNSSRYDRRHFTVRISESRIADIYDSIKDDMELRASAQNRLLSVDLPASLPTIAADPSSVSEVLGNLIDNAIKYSNEGGVIEVRAEHHGNDIEVEIEDHGIGMPANVVSNLFHKFYRSHRSRETVAGTGIGLYISKAIIESHGGEMHARSVEGEGSVFSFTLPVYASVAAKLEAAGGDNRILMSTHSGSWIKNHGSIRG